MTTIEGTEYVIDKLVSLILSKYNTELSIIDATLTGFTSSNVHVGVLEKISSYPFMTVAGISAGISEDQFSELGIHEHVLQVQPYVYSSTSNLELLERYTYRYALAMQRLLHNCSQLDDTTGRIVVAKWRGHQYETKADKNRAFISSALIFVSVMLVNEGV